MTREPNAENGYDRQSIWRRIMHTFGVPTYTDGEGPCVYCGRWH